MDTSQILQGTYLFQECFIIYLKFEFDWVPVFLYDKSYTIIFEMIYIKGQLGRIILHKQ